MLSARETELPDEPEYAELLRLRTDLRRFLARSERAARSSGLTAAQHQLLVAVRGHGGPEAPTIGDVADHLLLRHNSAVQLVNRAATAGIVRRRRDSHDARIVRLELTEKGEEALAAIAANDAAELDFLIEHLIPLDRPASAPRPLGLG